ncbi:hypothetical protein FQA39_LY17561 [Lamprigera yunnana]|nr:hypothetical protein FQA39_LY17561 [Lamprigera yunnana]
MFRVWLVAIFYLVSFVWGTAVQVHVYSNRKNEVLIDPKEVIVLVGDAFSLVCDTQSKKKHLEWIKITGNDEISLASSRSRKELKQPLKLDFETATVNDSAIYVCEDYKSLVNRTVIVRVIPKALLKKGIYEILQNQVVPPKLLITATVDGIETNGVPVLKTTVGNNVILRCKVNKEKSDIGVAFSKVLPTNKYKFELTCPILTASCRFKDEEEVYVAQPLRTSEVNLGPVQLSHQGRYVCTSTDGSLLETIDLQVEKSPKSENIDKLTRNVLNGVQALEDELSHQTFAVKALAKSLRDLKDIAKQEKLSTATLETLSKVIEQLQEKNKKISEETLHLIPIVTNAVLRELHNEKVLSKALDIVKNGTKPLEAIMQSSKFRSANLLYVYFSFLENTQPQQATNQNKEPTPNVIPEIPQSKIQNVYSTLPTKRITEMTPLVVAHTISAETKKISSSNEETEKDRLKENKAPPSSEEAENATKDGDVDRLQDLLVKGKHFYEKKLSDEEETSTIETNGNLPEKYINLGKLPKEILENPEPPSSEEVEEVTKIGGPVKSRDLLAKAKDFYEKKLSEEEETTTETNGNVSSAASHSKSTTNPTVVTSSDFVSDKQPEEDHVDGKKVKWLTEVIRDLKKNYDLQKKQSNMNVADLMALRHKVEDFRFLMTFLTQPNIKDFLNHPLPQNESEEETVNSESNVKEFPGMEEIARWYLKKEQTGSTSLPNPKTNPTVVTFNDFVPNKQPEKDTVDDEKVKWLTEVIKDLKEKYNLQMNQNADNEMNVDDVMALRQKVEDFRFLKTFLTQANNKNSMNHPLPQNESEEISSEESNVEEFPGMEAIARWYLKKEQTVSTSLPKPTTYPTTIASSGLISNRQPEENNADKEKVKWLTEVIRDLKEKYDLQTKQGNEMNGTDLIALRHKIEELRFLKMLLTQRKMKNVLNYTLPENESEEEASVEEFPEIEEIARWFLKEEQTASTSLPTNPTTVASSGLISNRQPEESLTIRYNADKEKVKWLTEVIRDLKEKYDLQTKQDNEMNGTDLIALRHKIEELRFLKILLTQRKMNNVLNYTLPENESEEEASVEEFPGTQATFLNSISLSLPEIEEIARWFLKEERTASTSPPKPTTYPTTVASSELVSNRQPEEILSNNADGEKVKWLTEVIRDLKEKYDLQTKQGNEMNGTDLVALRHKIEELRFLKVLLQNRKTENFPNNPLSQNESEEETVSSESSSEESPGNEMNGTDLIALRHKIEEIARWFLKQQEQTATTSPPKPTTYPTTVASSELVSNRQPEESLSNNADGDKVKWLTEVIRDLKEKYDLQTKQGNEMNGTDLIALRHKIEEIATWFLKQQEQTATTSPPKPTTNPTTATSSEPVSNRQLEGSLSNNADGDKVKWLTEVIKDLREKYDLQKKQNNEMNGTDLIALRRKIEELRFLKILLQNRKMKNFFNHPLPQKESEEETLSSESSSEESPEIEEIARWFLKQQEQTATTSPPKPTTNPTTATSSEPVSNRQLEGSLSNNADGDKVKWLTEVIKDLREKYDLQKKQNNEMNGTDLIALRRKIEELRFLKILLQNRKMKNFFNHPLPQKESEEETLSSESSSEESPEMEEIATWFLKQQEQTATTSPPKPTTTPTTVASSEPVSNRQPEESLNNADGDKVKWLTEVIRDLKENYDLQKKQSNEVNGTDLRALEHKIDELRMLKILLKRRLLFENKGEVTSSEEQLPTIEEQTTLTPFLKLTSNPTTLTSSGSVSNVQLEKGPKVSNNIPPATVAKKLEVSVKADYQLQNQPVADLPNKERVISEKLINSMWMIRHAENNGAEASNNVEKVIPYRSSNESLALESSTPSENYVWRKVFAIVTLILVVILLLFVIRIWQLLEFKERPISWRDLDKSKQDSDVEERQNLLP